MQRLSIARSLRLALLGLTIVLAVISVGGISALVSARQRYEDLLLRSSRLTTAAANLLSAGIAEAEVLRDVGGPGAPARSARHAAATVYDQAAATAVRLAREDPISRRLVIRQLAAERRARTLAAGGQLTPASSSQGPLATGRRLAGALQDRQAARQRQARAQARSDSRRAAILVIVAGVLALVAAAALVSALIRGLRRPLDELRRATGDLAGGQLDRRVELSGPSEIQDLGRAFNAMGGELTAAQERIETERRRLAVTIESLTDAVIVTEPASSRIAAVNARVAELLPELNVGERVDEPASPLPPLAEALEHEVELEHRARSLSITAAPLGHDGAGVVWTVRDTTERVRLERAKSEFVAMASHELRSPLTSIKGFIELLDRSSENMTDRQREFVDIILRSTDRLVELVGELLDVARIDADRAELDLRPIDAGEAVREVVELMRPRLEEKHQRLGMYIAPTLPLALADAGRVRQIIANLLTNAHLYTPQDGRIHIGLESERAWVQLVVADSGIGLSAEERERVFERFFRASASRGSPGTGLGLSIVKSLVEMHRGEIDVDSTPGRGTTFRVRLPAAMGELGDGRSLDAIRGRRVLIVDDEREVAELIAGQLAPLGVEAEIAGSGDEALERLRREHFDAVTLDVLMPGMDGFDVLGQIRDEPELAQLPIVFVSVFSGRRELAGEWVVPKPIDADELREVLGAAVRSGRSRVLVVAREELQPVLEPALDDLGIEHHWELSGVAAARVCGERRFEVALIDVGIRSPQAALQALDLRGRRLRRAVILFSDGTAPVPPGIGRLGIEVIPVQEAAGALLAALRGERPEGQVEQPGRAVD